MERLIKLIKRYGYSLELYLWQDAGNEWLYHVRVTNLQNTIDVCNKSLSKAVGQAVGKIKEVQGGDKGKD